MANHNSNWIWVGPITQMARPICEWQPGEAFLRAAGASFPAKMAFLGFWGHVVALLRSSYVPQAIFLCKNDVPGIFRTCNSPVEVFLRAAGAFWGGKSDSQMALDIFVMGEHL